MGVSEQTYREGAGMAKERRQTERGGLLMVESPICRTCW